MGTSKTFRIAQVLYGQAHVVISAEGSRAIDLACSRSLDMPVGKGRVFLSSGTDKAVTCAVCRKNNGLDDSVPLNKPAKRRRIQP